MLNRARSMQSALVIKVGSVSSFWGVIRTDVHGDAGHLNGCNPPATLFSYSKIARLVGRPGAPEVLRVPLMCNVSQIAKRIIERIPVNVVYDVIWPFAFHVKPCDPVSKINPSCHRNFNAPIGIGASNNVASATSFGNPDSPIKQSSDRVVINQLYQLLGSERSLWMFWFINRIGPIHQIVNSRVSAVSVFVANVLNRPLSIDIQPREASRPVGNVVNVNADSSVLGGVSSNASGGSNTPSNAPRKHASIWVVVKKFAQARCGKIGLSHDAVLSLIGQKPGSVSALSGLRYFSTGVM